MWANRDFNTKKQPRKSKPGFELSEDDPANAGLDLEYIEIDQQSKRQLAQAQIGEELGLVNALQRVNGLHLDNQLAFNQKVKAQPRVDLQTFVHYGRTTSVRTETLRILSS